MSVRRIPSSEPSRVEENSYVFPPSRHALNPMAPLVKSVGVVLSTALLRPGYEGGQSSPPTAEMKKTWFCNSNHPYDSRHST